MSHAAASIADSPFPLPAWWDSDAALSRFVGLASGKPADWILDGV